MRAPHADCTSNSGLRRNDLTGFESRSAENDWLGDDNDAKAHDFNRCIMKIIEIIRDQLDRPGNEAFCFTIEQPAGGRYPLNHFAILKSSRASGGCEAKEVQISFCRFLSGYIETVCEEEAAAFSHKPTLLWTNCDLLIQMCSKGLHKCGRPTHDAPMASPCQHHMEHTKAGGVR